MRIRGVPYGRLRRRRRHGGPRSAARAARGPRRPTWSADARRRAPRGDEGCERAFPTGWLPGRRGRGRGDQRRRPDPLRAARGRRPAPRRGADALRRGPAGPDLLLTERAHDMRSHPGQVSFPGGSRRPRRDSVRSRRRCARPRRRPGSTRPGRGLRTLPELWLPPSNFAVTPVLGWWREPESPVRSSSPAEVHAIHRVPIATCSTRAPGHDAAPARLPEPRLPDRPTTRTSSSGASPPASSRGSSTTSAGHGRGTRPGPRPASTCSPDCMLQATPAPRLPADPDDHECRAPSSEEGPGR
jgi:hypothetical protein